MSRLRRPFLSDRYIFVTVNLLRSRLKLEEKDFERLARSLTRMRQRHGFRLTAWVFLNDMNPVRRGLVKSPEDWKWSSVHEYSGVSPEEQERRCGLRLDRLRLPANELTRI